MGGLRIGWGDAGCGRAATRLGRCGAWGLQQAGATLGRFADQRGSPGGEVLLPLPKIIGLGAITLIVVPHTHEVGAELWVFEPRTKVAVDAATKSLRPPARVQRLATLAVHRGSKSVLTARSGTLAALRLR